MLYLQTSLPMNLLHSFFSNKIKGHVRLRRFEHGSCVANPPPPTMRGSPTYTTTDPTLNIYATFPFTFLSF